MTARRSGPSIRTYVLILNNVRVHMSHCQTLGLLLEAYEYEAIYIEFQEALCASSNETMCPPRSISHPRPFDNKREGS